MEWLLKKAEEFLARHKFIKRWRKALAVMMTVVVFVSTYAMILPAITLETDQSEGIGLFEETPSDESLPEDGSTVTESLPEDGSTVTESLPEAAAGGDELGEENAVLETAAVEPAFLDNEELIFENENLKLTLTVPAAAMVPTDAELTVREIGQPLADDGLDDEARKNEYLTYLASAETVMGFSVEESEYIKNTASNMPAAGVPWFRFFVLSMENAEGSILPACSLNAEIVYKNIDKAAADGLKVVCLGSDGNMVLTGSENVLAESADPQLALLTVGEELCDVSVKFMDAGTLAFGTFAADKEAIDEAIEAEKEESASEDESAEEVPEDESAEEVPEDESAEEVPEDESAEEVPEDESAEEVPDTEKTLVAVGADYTVTMTYTADAEIPEGARLTAEEILADDTAYEGYVNDAAEALDVPKEQTARVRARFFDIRIMVGEDEFEPAAPVRVDIAYAAPQEKAEAEKVSAVHFAEEGETPEVVEIADVTTDEKTEEVNGVSFDADSFSVYGVVYTVDFEWEVNGKTYEFSIPGGGYVSFYNLVEVLGISADTDSDADVAVDSENNKDTSMPGQDEISETAKKFVADVKSVIFSSPDLVWAGKIITADTVGSIKAANGLNCKYSLDLTEAEITEINAKTIDAGDWLLISIHPFTSEETLTVTMESGEQFFIKVTDDQINEFSSLKNNEKYVLYIEAGGNYYALDNEGNTELVPENDLDNLSSEYLWKFTSQENGTDHYANASNWVNGSNYLDVYWTNKEKPVAATSGGWPPIVTLVPVDGGGYIFRDLNPDRHTYNYPYSYMTYDLYQHRYLIDDYDGETNTHNIRTAFGEEYNAYYGDSYSDAVVVHVYKQGSSYSITAKTNNAEFGNVEYTYNGNEKETAVSNDSFTVNTENSVNKNKAALAYFTAVPETGYKFTGWEVFQVNPYDEYQVVDWGEGCTKDSASIKPTVDGNIILQAKFEPEKLYKLTVMTNDENMGTVGGEDKDGDPVTGQVNFETISDVVINNVGKNAYEIKAEKKPLHKFDHWELRDSEGNITELPDGSIIAAGALELNKDNMILTAVFAEKTDTEIDEDDIDTLLDRWKAEMTSDFVGVDKTAHVHDYDNRIYEIDLSASSGKWATERSINLDFITDTSRSMYFPANLEYAIKDAETSSFDSLSNWLEGKDTSNVYYVISDDNSATMYAVYYDGGWKVKDSSYKFYVKAGSSTSSSNTAYDAPNGLYLTGAKKTLTGYIYKSAEAPTSYHGTSANGKYWSRLDYLIKAVAVASETVYSIDPNSNISLTTFNANSERRGNLGTTEESVSDTLSSISLSGGTRQDRGLLTAYNGYNYSGKSDSPTITGEAASIYGSPFSDRSSNKQTAILISDGAPNFGNNTTGLTWDDITDQADKLKGIKDAEQEKLTLMTLGLSLNFVHITDQENFNDLASAPKYAQNANNGGQIVTAIKELVQFMVEKANLIGTVSDTLDPAFYPVKADGTPIEPGYYDMDGDPYTPTANDASEYCRWTKDGEVWEITYYNQTFKWPTRDNNGNITVNGWDQAFYVKAKENFLGGNTIETNGKTTGSTTFTATHTVIIDDEGHEIAGTKKEIKNSSNETITIVKNDISTPHVNVKQLTLDGNETEWTVYIEKEVDPLPQIKELYNHIEVQEVVDASTNSMITDKDAMLFAPGSGTTPETFLLKDAIRALTSDDWDDLTMVNGDGTIDIPYTKYDHTTGVISLTLTKEGEKAEYGNHATSSALTDVEEYVLRAQFIPYSVSEMQGNDSGDDGLYHTTAEKLPGTEQQAGKPCDNKHVVDLIVRGLSITKTNESYMTALPGAEFMVYRLATDDEIQNESDKIKTFDGAKYYPDHELDFDDTGVAYKNGVKALDSTTKYYLVETKAPQGYVLLEDPIPVQLTITDVYTLMPVEDGSSPVTQTDKPSSGIYNWEQRAKLEVLGDSGFIRTTGAYDPAIPETDLTHTPVEATAVYEVMYYRISNNPGVELPATGGPGTAALYLIGLMMVSFAGAGILMRRKQKIA